MPTHKTDSDGAIKKIKGQSKKYDIKKQQEDKFSKSLKKQEDEMNKFYKKNKKKDTNLDDIIKELKKIIEQQNDEQKKLLEQQKKLLEQQKQEEDIPWDIINELSRNANEMTEPINFRTFAPRKDLFDDINKNKETPSPSKIPAPISKSRKPQGVAIGEQSSIAIMKNKLETSKDYIEYLKK